MSAVDPRPGAAAAGTRRSVVLRATVDGLTPVLLLVAVFVTFRGHNAPGGGFAGGLIVATAIVLRYLAEGPRSLDRLRIDPVALIGIGLLVALATAVAPLFVGGALLESHIWQLDLPAIGAVKFVSSSIFDLGVATVVVGVVLTAVLAFVRADDDDRALPGDRP